MSHSIMRSFYNKKAPDPTIIAESGGESFMESFKGFTST